MLYFGLVFNIKHLNLSQLIMGLLLRAAFFFLGRSGNMNESKLALLALLFSCNANIQERDISDVHLKI